MSYIVLARKYRPQTFDEVFAQEHITTILKNAITFNRIAHAFLFTGSRGVGKTSLARILAKSLNCMEGLSATPCNKCENCREITQSTSTDVVEIDGASNTGVEDIRDLQKELMYATSKSRYKIFIIDEVHMLSKNAFNALLKTLEEPPEQVVFIFATTEPHKVLPTIISRCQRYDFKRIPIDAIVEHLRAICSEEKIKVEDEALYLVAKKAEGSMRDALSLMDQLIALGKQDTKTNDVLALFGIVSTDIYHKITEYIYQKNAAAIIGLIHNILDKGNDLQEFINGYLDYIRTMLLIKTKVPLPELPPTVREEMEKINQNFSEDTLLYILSILIKTKSEIKFSGNPVLITEMTFIKLTKIDNMKSLAEILKSLQFSDISPMKKPVTTTQKTRSEKLQDTLKEKMDKEIDEEMPKYTEITEQIYNETKDKLRRRLENALPWAADFFSDIKLIKIRNNIIHLKTTSQMAYDYLEKNHQKVSDIVSQFYRLDVKLHFVLEVEKKDKPEIIKNPTLEDIKRETPEIAEFIELTDATVRPLYDYKPDKKEPEPDK
ncbi:MAG: DNA polymerase III subunit gamma/tau [Candidatus Cloacimonetes bacterium]|nr:DNA polymerase III subunit gamma/tau [Candidatus Cloacimonadota bacterium]